MRPEDVNPNNFQVQEIIYNNDEFSIAYGTWDNGKKYLAMRWNGDGIEKGYPKSFGNPVWFLVDPDLTLAIVKSLAGLPSTDKNKLMRVLQEIL